jgi:hypothetical protein
MDSGPSSDRAETTDLVSADLGFAGEIDEGEGDWPWPRAAPGACSRA